MLTLALVLAVVFGFLSGSIWLFTAAVGALTVKLFPIVLVFFAIAGAAYLTFIYYRER